MALTYPNAKWRPLGAQTEDEMTGHDLVIVHTMVGYLTSTDRFFKVANGAGYQGTESHWGVGGPWGSDGAAGVDGTVWQWQDGRFSADANVDANRYAWSIETADNAPRLPEDIVAWSPAQVDALIHLLTWATSVEAHSSCPASWACRKVGIPRALVPDSKRGRRGIGYHQQGIDPWRVSSGAKWSTSTGKQCPTGKRIHQLRTTIIPAVAADNSAQRRPVDPPADPPTKTGKRTPRSLGVTSQGDTGPVVVLWQRATGENTDGVCGPATVAAIKGLQTKLRVAADGAAGPATLRAYLAYRGVLKYGDTDPGVRFVQAIGGVGTDGTLGGLTRTAVQEMQRWAGLDADGVVGPDTRNKIVR